MSAASEFTEAVDGLAPVAIRAAATLRLADHVAAGATTADALAARSGADPGLLRRLLAFLVARDVFAEPAPGEYALTALSVALLDGHSSRLRAWLDADGIGGRMDRAVGGLLDALRTGEAPYPALFGRSFYADLAAADISGRSFDLLRGDHAAGFAATLGAHDVWPDRGHVVDVGGGQAVLAQELLTARPGLRATVVDLPSCLEGVRERLDGAGVGDRCELVGGDFFAPLPAGANVYSLVNVLHNWDDADAVRILRRCAEAGGPTALTLVAEHLDSAADARTATAMDLRAFLFLGGRERSRAEYERLAESAGLRVRAAWALTEGPHLMELVAAPA